MDKKRQEEQEEFEEVQKMFGIFFKYTPFLFAVVLFICGIVHLIMNDNSNAWGIVLICGVLIITAIMLGIFKE